MSSKINLSYIFTTYNKFPYTKETIQDLIKNCDNDEEIVVVDGGSTDGSSEYLNELFVQGKIHRYISEKDFGEGHGINKGILSSEGAVIKLITDDDVFDYEIIKRCKRYFIENPSIDVLFANTASINSATEVAELNILKNYEVWFTNWAKGQTKNCFICCLPLMMRRKALANTGLFDTSFKHVDLEFSVRITSKKTNIAFCTGLMVCSNINTSSNSNLFSSVNGNEHRKVALNYDYVHQSGPIERKREIEFPSIIKRITNRLFPKKPEPLEYYPDYTLVIESNIATSNITLLNEMLLKFMKDYNKKNSIEFIERIL
ncbi:MAG: glycosyltransferase [Chitinophagaceae bacterium]|nr:MAG: glycosyltransferase [Chitinophagaceae bacterium]